jgi:hypothetical protein
LESQRISDKHIENIRQAVKIRRENHEEGADIKLSENDAHKGDFERPENKIKNYLTQLNVSIIYAKRHKREISIDISVKNLQQRLDKDLSAIWSDLILFFTEYNSEIIKIDDDFPYPWKSERVTTANYYQRANGLNQLKKDGVKRILELIGINKVCGGSEISILRGLVST